MLSFLSSVMGYILAFDRIMIKVLLRFLKISWPERYLLISTNRTQIIIRQVFLLKSLIRWEIACDQSPSKRAQMVSIETVGFGSPYDN